MTTAAERFDALLRGTFYKMTGSGNDFVFLDARAGGAPSEVPAQLVATVCARGTGVGADGLVILDQPGPGRVRIAYFNSDGSRASLCGNATLCTASLATRLGAVAAGEPFVIDTDAGAFAARAGRDAGPEFELAPVTDLQTEVSAFRREQGASPESRIGFAVAGVPHLVVQVQDAEAADVAGRGAELRQATAERPAGANVNFVSPLGGGRWRMRTYERGVEGETLACGTGAVASAALLRAWGEAGETVELVTSSGQPLRVRLGARPDGRPSLAGEGRLVFVGTLA